MISDKVTLKELGEKRLIAEFIIPLINPNGESALAGDDCAVIDLGELSVCISTDRVPSDLVSFKLGIINYHELGYYLAILNISDILASGARPLGILLNLAFPPNFEIAHFEEIMRGAKLACEHYSCNILGGDLSDSAEMNLVATSIGVAKTAEVLFRKGASDRDFVYCSDYVGLTPTAFAYFREAKEQGLVLSEEDEKILASVFRFPSLRSELSKTLAELKPRYNIICMDNTDGAYQTLHEIGLLNNIGVELDAHLIPVHPLSYKVADFLQKDIFDLIFSAGADFRLIGTVDRTINTGAMEMIKSKKLVVIGEVIKDAIHGSVILRDDQSKREIVASGWNYYSDSK